MLSSRNSFLSERLSVKTLVSWLGRSFVFAICGICLTAQAQTSKANGSNSNLAGQNVASSVAPNPRNDIFCAINEFRDGFPVSVRFQIRSVDEVEVRSTDRQGAESARAILKRIEIASQPKVAVFSIGGSAGVSGEAKLLLTKDALKFGEVSTMMIVNQTMRESGIYQCRKLPGSF